MANDEPALGAAPKIEVVSVQDELGKAPVSITGEATAAEETAARPKLPPTHAGEEEMVVLNCPLIVQYGVLVVP